MNGKVIVVTGASGALGKVVAETALTRGARIAGIDYAPAQIPATQARLELGGVDLTDPAQAKTAIDAAASHFGRLDALINIAGGFAFETVAEGDPKTWQRMYALNVTTALNASRAAIPHLAASSAARILNIGAMGALQAGAGHYPTTPQGQSDQIVKTERRRRRNQDESRAMPRAGSLAVDFLKATNLYEQWPYDNKVDCQPAKKSGSLGSKANSVRQHRLTR